MQNMKVSELLSDKIQSKQAGINQPIGLVDFGYEVEQAIPGCKVVPVDHMWSWVYMPDDHFAMGRIGYGVFSQNGKGGHTYTVQCRTIQNGKYNDYSPQYNMKSSTSRPTAVKNAKKFLRRYNPLEVAQVVARSANDGIHKMKRTLRDDIAKVEMALFGATLSTYRQEEPLLLTEMVHLMNSGHKFFTPELADKLAQYRGLKQEYDNAAAAYNMWFVQVNKQRVNVIPIDDLAAYAPGYGDIQTYHDEVPEEIAGKVAVLSMVEDNTYVHGVGFKEEDGLYYVAR
jgi:hypothetical protein